MKYMNKIFSSSTNLFGYLTLISDSYRFFSTINNHGIKIAMSKNFICPFSMNVFYEWNNRRFVGTTPNDNL